MAFAQNQQQQYYAAQQQQQYYQQQQQAAAYQQQQQQHQQGSAMQGVQSTASTSNGNNMMNSVNAPSARGPDYVVFERLPQQAFSRSGLEKATAAKLKLEHYYKKAVDDVVERNTRYVLLSVALFHRCRLTRRVHSSPRCYYYARTSLRNPGLYRRHELEQKLIADTVMPDKEKKNQILALGRTESSFLRLRRTRLGLKDFKTVKVIGKGAFGEVSWLSIYASTMSYYILQHV